jgi:Zn finger protein HypA/HybF involved in hydrogenase expression
MPMYEYQCSKCETLTEFNVPIDQRDGYVFCPDCTSNMKRLISPPGVIFKGGGWGGQG